MSKIYGIFRKNYVLRDYVAISDIESRTPKNLKVVNIDKYCNKWVNYINSYHYESVL